MSKVDQNSIQLGNSATATQNFTLQTNLDGTAKFARGNAGATTQDILTVDASGATAIRGTGTNNDASGGFVGEYVESDNMTGTVSLTSSVGADVTSITLTAGDWDVTGVLAFSTAAATTVIRVGGSVSSVSGSAPSKTSAYITYPASVLNTGANGSPVISIRPCRFSLSATTTIFLVAFCYFGTSTMTAGGIITARRVR